MKSIKLSKYPFKSQKDQTNNQAIDRMVRGGYIMQVASGIYSYNNLALRSLEKLNKLIRKHMDPLAYETIMPLLQPMNIWKESGRDNIYGENMFKLVDRHKRSFCLSPTSEEAIVKLAEFFCDSKNHYPFSLYQMGRKYRDEFRPRCGIIRGRSFWMKDAYSFAKDKETSMKQYREYIQAYINFFKELDLKIYITKSDCGEIGGHLSHEFSVESQYGNDIIYVNKNIKNNIENLIFNSNKKKQKGNLEKKVLEIAQTYYLGTRYSKKMKMNNPFEKENYPEMGCYGIGTSRVFASLMEKPYLPPIISPFKFFVIDIANKYIDQLEKLLSNALIDDRKVSFGCSKADSETIGIPYVIIIGKNFEFHDYYKNFHKNFQSFEELIDFSKKYDV